MHADSSQPTTQATEAPWLLGSGVKLQKASTVMAQSFVNDFFQEHFGTSELRGPPAKGILSKDND